jgi:hypothetical protein
VRRAARLDANHAEIVEAFKAAGCGVLSLAGLGNGVPDLLVVGPDAMRGGDLALFLVEIKDGSKPKSQQALTADQVRFHADWPVFIVRSVAEVREMFK